ncbi:L-threonylcarbamoyladenylate synthase [Anaerolineales bacterium HSG24]|nr:L-threonylcarbamoyladenylate synthase [Anaerolineales bacterium HSG24]
MKKTDLTLKIMTQQLPIISRKAIKLARRLLREGELVALPTDTVYGLAANAFDQFAVRKVFAVKQRPLDKGLPVFISQIDDVCLVAKNIPSEVRPMLNQFWPGALTVVFPKNDRLLPELTGGAETIAVRLPNHLPCLELVNLVGQPLVATSANISGRPTPSTAREVSMQLAGKISLILDGGPTPSAVPSTVVDVSCTPPRILRQGAIPVAELQAYLPTLSKAIP